MTRHLWGQRSDRGHGCGDGYPSGTSHTSTCTVCGGERYVYVTHDRRMVRHADIHGEPMYGRYCPGPADRLEAETEDHRRQAADVAADRDVAHLVAAVEQAESEAQRMREAMDAATEDSIHCDDDDPEQAVLVRRENQCAAAYGVSVTNLHACREALAVAHRDALADRMSM